MAEYEKSGQVGMEGMGADRFNGINPDDLVRSLGLGNKERRQLSRRLEGLKKPARIEAILEMFPEVLKEYKSSDTP